MPHLDGDTRDGGDGLHAPAAGTRARAAALLAHTGRWPRGTSAALTELVLSDPSAAVRQAALHALVRRARLGRAMFSWEAATEDPDESVRRAAAMTATQLATRLRAGATPVAVGKLAQDLIALLDDRAALVAETSAFALSEIVADGLGGETAAATVGVLVRHAEHHGDPLVREACVAGLGALRAADVYGSEDALGVVLAAARDKPAIRRRAVIALSAFDDPEAEQALRDALTDRDWQVRQLAEDLTSD